MAKYSGRVGARFFQVVAIARRALPLLVLAAGCGTSDFRKAGPARADKARPAAVVVFAAPPRAKVWLTQGVQEDAGWTCESAAGEMVQVASEGGFVVAKLPARTGKEKYAIAEVAIPDGSDRRLRLGANAKVPVFNAIPGKVTMVGGVKVLEVGAGLSLLPDPSATRARAARFLAERDRRMSASVAKGKAAKVGNGQVGNGKVGNGQVGNGKVGNGKMSWVALPDSCERR